MGIRVISAPPQQPSIQINAPAPPQEQNAAPKYQRLPVDKDIAMLEVRGSLFTNWTSVRVEQKWTEAFPTFTFECTEQVDTALNVTGDQFVPGDVVRVLLGGAPAVYGYITERHTGYDQGQHGIRLIGCGDTADLVTSSVPLEKLNGHDGKTLTQLARDLSAHLNIGVIERGDVDATPFENIQVIPGETPIQTIERYAKMRNVLIGSEANGGLLLIGEHPATSLGWLVEGINIKAANAAQRDPMIYKQIFAVGANKADDKANGDPTNKQHAVEQGSSARDRHLVIIADVADTGHGIQRRAQMEKIFTEGSFLEAQITVQGWFKDANTSDDIWRAGEYYDVTSPSLIMYDMVLGCAGCTYEQSEKGGTTTTLQMVLPIHMNGLFNYRQESLAYRTKILKDQQAKEDAAAAAVQALREGGVG